MVQFDVKRVQKGTESFMVSFDFTKTPVTQIADYIIIAASKHNASDIHFDPREEGMMVRFRIDGDCQDYTFVPKAYEKNLTTRLKILANMNITESRLPQDGAIKGTFGDQYLDMRVSSLPLNEGEKIVIRILDYTRSLQGIDSLGFHPKNLEKVKRMMEIPNGIILTTGATGSGKSTTTYSILQGLNRPEKNIITVEDPIEMNIEGINQVQVNADIGMTFAAALRSILRQDPNVILIGEIRDSETAQIAVRASITGHLVLSTIHTNNTLSTVERLLDMDVERYLLSTALSGIISQRLAKMLCPDCKYQRETTKYEKKVFKKYMDMDVTHVWDANPKGCDHCRKGYHGRIALHEVLELDDDIRGAISNEKLAKKDLAKMVYSGSTITMLQDALIKCLEGITSFEEVYRTIEIESEDDDNYENEMENEIKESIPVEEVVQTSDDLLETPINKTKDENDISTLLTAPAFTAASFADVPEENTDENGNQEEKKDTTEQGQSAENKESQGQVEVQIPQVEVSQEPPQEKKENKEQVVIPSVEVPQATTQVEIPQVQPQPTESVVPQVQQPVQQPVVPQPQPVQQQVQPVVPQVQQVAQTVQPQQVPQPVVPQQVLQVTATTQSQATGANLVQVPEEKQAQVQVVNNMEQVQSALPEQVQVTNITTEQLKRPEENIGVAPQVTINELPKVDNNQALQALPKLDDDLIPLVPQI
jgi:type IV pilus assembly protein PilB